MYILLCGYPPFKGKTHQEIFNRIQSGKFNFAGAEWKNVTREAKLMIKNMLKFKPEERYSAEQALKDQWIMENNQQYEKNLNEKLNDPVMMQMIDNLKQINVRKLAYNFTSYFFRFNKNFSKLYSHISVTI